jgi:hypothetical protein
LASRKASGYLYRHALTCVGDREAGTLLDCDVVCVPVTVCVIVTVCVTVWYTTEVDGDWLALLLPLIDAVSDAVTDGDLLRVSVALGVDVLVALRVAVFVALGVTEAVSLCERDALDVAVPDWLADSDWDWDGDAEVLGVALLVRACVGVLESVPEGPCTQRHTSGTVARKLL